MSTSNSGEVPVLIEIRAQSSAAASFALGAVAGMAAASFTPDPTYQPVPMSSGSAGEGAAAGVAEQTYVVRGTVRDANAIAELEQHPDVVKVWTDAQIEGFFRVRPQPVPAAAPCPIGVCDCDPDVAKGTMADVATYLGVPDIWAAGFRGTGIVVGVVDGGILAVGRTPSGKVSRVIGGFPTNDWGTVARWGEHGCMTATDTLGMAPDAQLYDIRISDPATASGSISAALQGYQWAIDQHALNGTPHILTNSWGMYQEAWATDYASDPAHPFTRKVVEALDRGILVLFAAGNCGDTCPDGRCGPDNGPSRDIWGANGHPRVITVGAVNKNEEFVGYSSRGPAALDANKPDICSVTHFEGYFPGVNSTFPTDSGTSAATPILAGVVAVLKQAKPSATQDEIKDCLKRTAKDIGMAGWDQHSGTGIVRAKQALDALLGGVVAGSPSGGGANGSESGSFVNEYTTCVRFCLSIGDSGDRQTCLEGCQGFAHQ